LGGSNALTFLIFNGEDGDGGGESAGLWNIVVFCVCGNHLMWLSPWEGFTEFCHQKSFKTCSNSTYHSKYSWWNVLL